MIEIRGQKLKSDPSQGSHFFQNITSLGIHYITLTEGNGDHMNWGWLDNMPAEVETEFLRHVRLEKPMILKIDGRKSRCVIIGE